MKLSTRIAIFVLAALFVATGISFFSASTRAQQQDEGWIILRADYGHKEYRVDVMDRLTDLLARSGPNGAIEVNYQTMGGDPAPGKAKSLRIFTKNSRGETREFEINEGHFVEAHFFAIRRPDRIDKDARPGRSEDWDRDDYGGLRIVRAYYGVEGRTVNVTDLLRSRVRDDSLSFLVTNSVLGGDPAVGYDKTLIVVYRYQGTETATAVREGNMLSLP